MFVLGVFVFWYISERLVSLKSCDISSSLKSSSKPVEGPLPIPRELSWKSCNTILYIQGINFRFFNFCLPMVHLAMMLQNICHSSDLQSSPSSFLVPIPRFYSVHGSLEGPESLKKIPCWFLNDISLHFIHWFQNSAQLNHSIRDNFRCFSLAFCQLLEIYQPMKKQDFFPKVAVRKKWGHCQKRYLFQKLIYFI